MIIWTDIETTGLDFEKDGVLEVAMVPTDDDLSILGTRYCVIKAPKRKLRRMVPFVREMHTKSGLLDDLARPNVVQPLKLAELDFIDFLDSLNAPQENLVMAGNSVGFDHRFLEKFMPNLMQRFSYQVLDVSSVRHMVERWAPKKQKEWRKIQGETTHRALDDTLGSIRQLDWYRKYAMRIDAEV